jgi:hypothetical protein
VADKEKVANWGKSCPAPACSISGSVLVSLFWFVLHSLIVHIHLIVTFFNCGLQIFLSIYTSDCFFLRNKECVYFLYFLLPSLIFLVTFDSSYYFKNNKKYYIFYYNLFYY